MPATKYDAMIAALDMIQRVTDKPDWKLKEDELALREKMHGDELEMSLMMTQIKTGISDIDNIQDEINRYDIELTDIKARILGTGKAKLDDIKPYEKTETGQATPEEMFEDYDKKYKNHLITLEHSKRAATERLNKLKYRYKLRGEEVGKAIGDKATQDQIDKVQSVDREERRLKIAEDTQVEMSKIRADQESRASSKYAGTDPAAIEDSMNTLYAGLQTQIGKDGLFTSADMLDYAENLGGVYATNAEQIATKLTILFTTSMTGESFLTALENEDPIYKQFLMEEGMPTAPSMEQLHLLSLSGSVQGNQTGTIDASTEIEDLLKGLPPLVRRNK